MSLSSRTRLVLAGGLSLVVLAAVHGAASAHKPDPKPDPDFDKKTVTFRTVDAVDLKGTLWTNTKAKSKKSACVLLLHEFSRKGGGDRSEAGWTSLAEDLVKEGYTVLSFDFRGHGDSTSVGKDFWTKKYPHNLALLKPPIPSEPPTKIDYKDFKYDLNYYPHLVDDIAAAKAYLDTKVSDGAGNLVVIGAGESAALGSMWVASEFRRYRDRTENIMPGQPMRPNLEDKPEGKDIACCIWLGLGNSIDGRLIQTQINNWMVEVGGKHYKTPMLFMYGKDDPPPGSGKKNAEFALTKMMPGYKVMGSEPGLNMFKDSDRKEEYHYTRDYAIDTKLEGSQMLQPSLNTNKVIKLYIKDVLEERGNKESKRHDSEKFRYYWISPGMNPIPAKVPGDEFMNPIPLKMMGLAG
jgi:hypothetical protein